MSHYGTEMIQHRDAINRCIEEFAKKHWKDLESSYEKDTGFDKMNLKDDPGYIEQAFKEYYDEQPQGPL